MQVSSSVKIQGYTKEQYQQCLVVWKSNKYHTASEHIAYNLIRGKSSDYGFTPIKESNHSKIMSNSNDPWHGFTQALRKLKLMFDDTSKWNVAPNNSRLKVLESKLGIKINEEFRSVILSQKWKQND